LTPMPFPGVHPTRWAFWYVYDPRPVEGVKRPRNRAKTKPMEFKKFVYVGKPCREIAIRLTNLIRMHYGYITAMEYDRGGAIARARKIPTPILHLTFNISHHSPVLTHFYYPFEKLTAFITPWESKISHRQRFVYKGRPFVVYSPNTKYNLTLPARKEFKSWLERYDIQLGKPSTSTK